MKVRSNRRTRTKGVAAAMLVVGGSALVGLGGVGSVGSAAAAAVVVVPSGGCWTYVPSGAELDSVPASDISTSREPWSASGQGGVELVTSGPTAVGSQRHVAVTVTDGPVLSTTTATTGTASFFISLDGTPAAAPATAAFSLAAGEAIDELVAQVDVPVGPAGERRVGLVGVYFDAPGQSIRMACNGQPAGIATKNAATDPRSTDVSAAYTAVTGPTVKVASILDQAVTVAARPADVVTLSLAGYKPAEAAMVETCATAGSCTPVASSILNADGGGTLSFMVPASVPVGPGTLQVGDGTTIASVPFTVLGTQTMVATENITGAGTTTVTFNGTGWDPRRDVALQGHLGASGSSSPSSDRTVELRPDATGVFTATYAVRDADTVSIVAEQARSGSRIGSIYLTSGVVGLGATNGGSGDGDTGGDAGGDTGGDDTDTTGGATGGTPTGSGTTTGTTGGAVSTPTTTTPTPGTAAPAAAPAAELKGELEISDIRLDGQNGISDIFGGAPARTLVFVVENTGKAAVASPMIRVAVARSDKAKPLPVAVPMSDLPVGGRAIVSVPVELPPAALGGYHVIVQVGDDEAGGSFKVAWSSFPWGLLTFNAIGLAILIVGLVPFVADRLPRRQPVPGLVRPVEGDAIVDLRAAERWWAARSAKTRSRAS